MLTPAAIVIATAPWIAAALAATPREDCQKLRGAAAMPACTQLIEDKQQTAPARALAYYLRARAALDTNELGKAEADIAAGHALQQSPFGLRVRARLRMLQGRNPEAREDYTRAIQISSTPEAKYTSYTDRGYYFVRQAAHTEARVDFVAAIEIDPNKPFAYVGRALVSKAENRFADAHADLDKALQVDPNHWTTHNERGDLLTGEKKFAEAIAAYDKALAAHPNDARAQRGKAIATALLGGAGAGQTTAPSPPNPPAAPQPPANPQTAKPSTPSAAPSATPAAAPPSPATPAQAPPSPPANQPSTSPPSPATPAPQDEARKAKLKEAAGLRAKGKIKEALAIYDDILKAAPDEVETLLEKGYTLVRTARWKSAHDTLKIVTVSKTAPPSAKAYAHELLAEIFARNDDYGQAQASADQSLQIDPKRPAALHWRAFAYYHRGSYDKAAADYEQAAALAPKDANHEAWRALALLGLGKSAEAQVAIDKAFAIQPGHQVAMAARARMKLVAGDADGADADIRRLPSRDLSSIALQTKQMILLHRVLKATDGPRAAAKQ